MTNRHLAGKQFWSIAAGCQLPFKRGAPPVTGRGWISVSNLSVNHLVPGGTTTLPDAVGVNGSTATTDSRADQGTLLTAGDTADESAGTNATRRRQLIPMFVPEAATMFVAISYTSVMSMGNVAMPVSQSTAGPGGRWDRHDH